MDQQALHAYIEDLLLDLTSGPCVIDAVRSFPLVQKPGKRVFFTMDENQVVLPAWYPTV